MLCLYLTGNPDDTNVTHGDKTERVHEPRKNINRLIQFKKKNLVLISCLGSLLFPCLAKVKFPTVK